MSNSPAPLQIDGSEVEVRPDAIRVDCVILLAGKIGRHEFADAIGRSVLDLPISERQTILDVWVERLSAVCDPGRADPLSVRIALGADDALPTLRASSAASCAQFSFVRDASEYRGTGGVVKDLTAGLDNASRVLVVTAHQLCGTSLLPIACGMDDEEVVAVVPHGAGDFASAFVLRRDRLADVPDIGFVDLKEQVLTERNGRPGLRVVRGRAGESVPIRTLAEYIAALRMRHRGAETGPSQGDAEVFAESWRPSFSIVEPGASVAADATLQDSVVLAGGRVEAAAVVARSVVCPGGVVARGKTAVDQIVRA